MTENTDLETLDASAAFWSPAYPRVQIWRTVLGFIIIAVAFIAVTFGAFVTGAQLLGTTPADIIDASTPAKATVFFLTFLGCHLGLWVALKALHKRSFRSLFGPTLNVNWRKFKAGLLIAVGIGLIAILLQFVEPLFLPQAAETITTQTMPLKSWLMIALPALLLILMQIFAEELVFRGYLLQQLRARFRSIWIWAIFPSLTFGLLHFDPMTYGVNAYFYVLHTSVIGIVLAIVTIQTGNIGAAAGLHFGNNAMLIFSGTKGSLDGFSLFLTELDLRSLHMSWSMLSQTTLTLIAFGIWWMLSQRKQPIANTAQAD